MKVTQNKIVSIHYNVTDVAGNIVDSNTDFEPLQYLHGAGHILPALELLLVGAIESDLKQVTLEPPIVEEKLFFKIWVEEIRWATAKELLAGQHQKITEECGTNCSCHTAIRFPNR